MQPTSFSYASFFPPYLFLRVEAGVESEQISDRSDGCVQNVLHKRWLLCRCIFDRYFAARRSVIRLLLPVSAIEIKEVVHYATPERQLWSDSNTIYRSRNFHSIEGGWSNDNWNVRFTAANIFNKGWVGASLMMSSDYYS